MNLRNNLKVIILAAGCCRRMRPLTNTCHKALLDVGGKSILQRIIDACCEFDLNDINIVTGYRNCDIQDHLNHFYPNLTIKYIHNPVYETTNNIYSLALAFKELAINTDVILIESDIVFEPSILKQLLLSPRSNVALVDSYKNGMDGTVITLTEQNVISSVVLPHLQGEDFNFKDKYKTLNIYKFSKELCLGNFGSLLGFYTKTIDQNCYYELVLGLLIYVQKAEIFAEIIQHEARWVEVDTPHDLVKARFIFDQDQQKKILDGSYGGFWNYDILDFYFLRNMYFPTPAVLSDLKNNLVNLLQNYGSSQDILNKKLANYLLCQKDKLIVLNGLTQIYPILKDLCVNKRLLIPSPSFGEYEKISPTAVTYADAVGIDLAEIHEKSASVDMIVFVNPNNPAGTTLSSQWIYDFARLHSDKIIIVDESFINFSNEKSIMYLLEEVPLPNVMVLSSLSKILGVPGMRLGFVYMHNPLIQKHIIDHLPIWNINSMAEYFLEIILKHREAIEDSFKKVTRDRKIFEAALQGLGIVEKVYPSGGNFLLTVFNISKEKKDNFLNKLLINHRIYVKDVSHRFEGKKILLRIAVRNQEDNLRLVQILDSINY